MQLLTSRHLSCVGCMEGGACMCACDLEYFVWSRLKLRLHRLPSSSPWHLPCRYGHCLHPVLGCRLFFSPSPPLGMNPMLLSIFQRDTAAVAPLTAASATAAAAPSLSTLPARFRYRALMDEEIAAVEVCNVQLTAPPSFPLVLCFACNLSFVMPSLLLFSPYPSRKMYSIGPAEPSTRGYQRLSQMGGATD